MVRYTAERFTKSIAERLFFSIIDDTVWFRVSIERMSRNSNSKVQQCTTIADKQNAFAESVAWYVYGGRCMQCVRVTRLKFTALCH